MHTDPIVMIEIAQEHELLDSCEWVVVVEWDAAKVWEKLSKFGNNTYVCCAVNEVLSAPLLHSILHLQYHNGSLA